MLHLNLLAVNWWLAFTVVAVWAHRLVPGVDLFAPAVILSMQEEGGQRTLLLVLIWVLLQEGAGNLPFGYGVAWYLLLMTMYFMGRWLFEARSFLFMCLLGIGLGVLHPMLVYALAALANLSVDLRTAMIEGGLQALAFPVAWLILDALFPKRLRRDVRPL